MSSLSHLTRLESLNLSCCDLISDEGILSFSSSLHSLHSLHSLDLSNCDQISPLSLTSLISNNTSLQKFHASLEWDVIFIIILDEFIIPSSVSSPKSPKFINQWREPSIPKPSEMRAIPSTSASASSTVEYYLDHISSEVFSITGLNEIWLCNNPLLSPLSSALSFGRSPFSSGPLSR
jgi:hypothetical protein